jgi:hypothetical protein
VGKIAWHRDHGGAAPRNFAHRTLIGFKESIHSLDRKCRHKRPAADAARFTFHFSGEA